MLKTVDTTTDEQANTKLIEPIQSPRLRRTFVTIFSEELRVPEIALLSEVSLTQDRHPPEKNSARANLQPE